MPQQRLGVLVGDYLKTGALPKDTVSKWFKGRSEPTARQLVAIAAVTGTTVERLVLGEICRKDPCEVRAPKET